MRDPKDNTINNAGSNPDGETRRSGGSPNDHDGGHELLGREWKGPNPDPINELVPGGQGAEAPPYNEEEITSRMSEVASEQPGPGLVELGTSQGKENPRIGTEPSRLNPIVDPTSYPGRQREGMSEAGGEDVADSGALSARDFSTGTEEQAATSTAYTDSQKSNLPHPESNDPLAPDHVQGAGRLEEPVEQRQNGLVFDRRSGNFRVEDEEQGAGVSPQDTI